MGFLDRLGKIAGGFKNTLQAPLGLVYDLARAPFVDDDELDGFINTVYGRTVARGGQALGGAMGADSGLGALIDVLPSQVRTGVGAVVNPVMEGLETVGREVIREPLTTAMTMASQIDSGGGLNVREAYRIAQKRSLGQAVALGILTDDITDEADVAKAMGGDLYGTISGVMDAATRIMLEPDVLLGKSIKAARLAGTGSKAAARATKLVPGGQKLADKGIIGRTIKTNADREAAMASPALQTFKSKVLSIREEAGSVDVAAAKIRDVAFHDSTFGSQISRVLAEVDPDQFDNTMAALMGDNVALDAIKETRKGIGGEIDRLTGKQRQIKDYRRQASADQQALPFELERAEAGMVADELEERYGVQAHLDRVIEAEGGITQMPRVSGLAERRHNARRSEFFQDNILAAPLRLATEMRPRGLVDLNDTRGDIQVSRQARKAGLPLEEQDRLRGAYMAATDEGSREAVLRELDQLAIVAKAKKYGITDPVEIKQFLDAAEGARGTAKVQLQESRIYDGKGRAGYETVDDNGTVHRKYQSVAATQLSNDYPLVDLDTVDQVFERHAKDPGRLARVKNNAVVGKAQEVSTQTLTTFQNLWKPSVLLRVGWPIRVVGEEQLRIASKIGALATVQGAWRGGSRFIRDITGDKVIDVAEIAKRVPKAERRVSDPRLEEQMLLRGRDQGTMTIRGWDIQKAAGTPADAELVYSKLNSARPSMEQFMSTEGGLLDDMGKEVTGEWRSINPDEVSYGPAWEHAVNKQIMGDELWRRFVAEPDWTWEKADDWLRGTPEGQAYAKRMSHWRGKEEQWLMAMEDIANDYLPTEGLRAKAAAGNVSAKDLAEAVPDAGLRPVAHGAILADVTGTTVFSGKVKGLRDTWMRRLGTIPTDVLSRNPYFDSVYTSEVNRRVNMLADQGVDFTPERAADIEKKARFMALDESKKLLYDLGEQSELAQMMRFVMPFYSAWGEVMTRWAGITVESPAFVARMHQVWQAPERMGIVVDENGNRLDENGNATNAAGEKVEAGKDSFISITLPQYAIDNLAKVPGLKGIRSQGGVRLNKDGFNTILQGLPGVGPMVQIPLNEIAKDRPDLEASLKWALPFGTTQDTMDMLLPATAKRIKTAAGGEEDRVYRNTLMRIYYDGIVDHNLGKREDQPTYEEAKRKADEFYKLRTLASFISPVAPQFTSPYQPYIDEYRALKEADEGRDRNAPGYVSPDEIFLERHGDDFFPLTQSLSRSVDGVPPTLEGAAARKKYQDMIESHPELGGLIIGAEGAGEFSRAVYDSQLSKKVKPGGENEQREGMSFEEAAAAPNIRLGWQEYGKAMDLVDAEMINRGLPNLRVKAAKDLAGIKRGLTAAIAAKYPEWHADFAVVDRAKDARKLAGMREIAADDRLAGRDDIAGLREYLQARDAIAAELKARAQAGGALTLEAVDNEDLDGAWEQMKMKMIERNLAFGALYHRWLENDKIEAEV